MQIVICNGYHSSPCPCVPQGCWRKLTVDDTIPFDEQDNMLLPASTNEAELWPMLLAKALIKLANTEWVGPSIIWVLLGDNGRFVSINMHKCCSAWELPSLVMKDQDKHMLAVWLSLVLISNIIKHYKFWLFIVIILGPCLKLPCWILIWAFWAWIWFGFWQPFLPPKPIFHASYQFDLYTNNTIAPPYPW